MKYWSTYKSPLGTLVLKSDGLAIKEISFAEGDLQGTNECALLRECEQLLDNYFSGISIVFDLPLDPLGTVFQKKVWDELLKIPVGETITYSELAVRLGDPKLVRAVGTANGRNPIAIVIPCHRVIGLGNKLIGYAGGLDKKRWLLSHEMKYHPSKGSLF